ncbi:MAG TPA: hypothetical protein VK184_07220 [Nostocaceae cyanobacterium]|nr:hypothetical protein [Nostocaceae cyanobacterium]
MNVLFPRFLKSAYRKEPVISALITVGVVDSIIGGFNDSWSLFAFGLGTAGVTLAIKLWRFQQRPSMVDDEPVVQRYLPPHSSSSAVPLVNAPKKKSRS